MINLASVVSKDNVIKALEKALKEKPLLRKATKFSLEYKNEFFPPKEVIRLAALEKGISLKDFPKYRLVGGRSTNKYLERMDFTINQFANWKTKTNNPEERIARLTFNMNDWTYPSGWEGKSKTTSYESENGYGHEEWIFDFSKIIDGYKYGFLEPINKNFKKYEDKTFNIYLFTIDSRTREKIWVGKINDIKVISKKQSEKIKAIYKEKGWYNEMKDDLKK